MGMTATDELRRMLDERGVEWEGQEDVYTDFTFWCGVHACETGPEPSLAVYHLTPAQAIAATLGNEGVGRSNDGVAELEAENARLRELVADMYKAFMHGACYRWCEFKEPCNYISDGKCQWYDRGHELGVEVDDG